MKDHFLAGIVYRYYVAFPRLRDHASRGYPLQINMYTVYILKSDTTGKRYIGYTEDLDERIQRHNRGLTQTTRNIGRNWKIIYKEEFKDKKEALLREKTLKKMKGGLALQGLLNSRV